MPSEQKTSARRIGLVHATTLSMEPVKKAFSRHWPEARVFHVLDNSLSDDRNQSAGLTADLTRRIRALADYTLSCGTDGLLFTCSAFGEAIETVAAAAPVPVLKPNEAMFERALESGGSIVMLATFKPSIASMEKEFRVQAGGKNRPVNLRSVCVPEARTALNAGDVESHNRVLAEAAKNLANADAIMLAHFSMDRAVQEIEKCVDIPVLSAPVTAVSHLKKILRA